MFDHVGLRVSDRATSERFYRTVLAAAGLAEPEGTTYLEWDDFSIADATAERPVTRGLHVGISVASRELVDAFWRAGVDAGFEDDGAPGPRDYTPSYYGAFLRDPDGNSIEAVHREGRRTDGNVDHLWIRVADVATARAFYDTIAPHAPIRVATDTAERVSFVRAGFGGADDDPGTVGGADTDDGAGTDSGGGGGAGGAAADARSAAATIDPGVAGDAGAGSFSLVAGGERTSPFHFAFLAPDHATVDAFHAAAVGAGYTDNGAPGPRSAYSPGYYGAFVLDPDGHNVESVHHDVRRAGG